MSKRFDDVMIPRIKEINQKKELQRKIDWWTFFLAEAGILYGVVLH